MQTKAKRITKADELKRVIWHGFDGKDYQGRILLVRNRMARIAYEVQGLGTVDAYAPVTSKRIERVSA